MLPKTAGMVVNVSMITDVCDNMLSKVYSRVDTGYCTPIHTVNSLWIFGIVNLVNCKKIYKGHKLFGIFMLHYKYVRSNTLQSLKL